MKPIVWALREGAMGKTINFRPRDLGSVLARLSVVAGFALACMAVLRWAGN